MSTLSGCQAWYVSDTGRSLGAEDHDSSCLRVIGPGLWSVWWAMRQTCRWNLGTTYRRQALFMCEGSPASPRSPTGHPRNKQNGSEECPRSSYHAGRGHQAQGGRLMMKIALVLAAATAVLTTAPLATPTKAQELKMAQGIDVQIGRDRYDRYDRDR